MALSDSRHPKRTIAAPECHSSNRTSGSPFPNSHPGDPTSPPTFPQRSRPHTLVNHEQDAASLLSRLRNLQPPPPTRRCIAVRGLTITTRHIAPTNFDHLHPPFVLTTFVPWGGDYPPDPPPVNLGCQRYSFLTHPRSMQLTRCPPRSPAAYHIGLPFRIDCAGVLSERISELRRFSAPRTGLTNAR
ncbi:hypothetical protein NMY22_g9794 [Coprinellus aureogranulatus]|nr:hypothetical protein NMY22_g9794 [Coprinellus aureogranulatus]